MYSIIQRTIHSIVGPSSYYVMKSSPDPPTPPDPFATAQAQTQANKETAQFQQEINLLDQYTPTGSLTYTQHPTDPNRWVSTASLTPSGQESYDLQQEANKALSGLAVNTASQAGEALGTPLDFGDQPDVRQSLNLTPFDLSFLGDLPEVPELGTAPQWDEAARQRAEDALYGLQTTRLDPFYERDRTELENRLINSGMQKGSPGYDQAVEEWTRSRDEAYRSARESSISGSTDFGTASYGASLSGYQANVNSLLQELAAQLGIRQTGFGEAVTGANIQLSQEQAQAAQEMAARQQGISEETYLRNLPLNEIAALLGTGQISMPQFGAPPATSVAGTPIGQYVYGSANMEQQQWQQEMQNQASILGGLFGMGGRALGGWSSTWGG